MPRLIHLNGPPGIGKSTLAQMYVDDHHGALNLDIDQVRCLVGGWRDDFGRAGELVRPIALGMATTHLQAGHDVVLPQYLGRHDEIEKFEAVARNSNADFRELVLLDDKENSIDRFSSRGSEDSNPWHGEVQRIVERHGGRTLLASMYDDLLEIARSRESVHVVRSRAGAAPDTYRVLLAALQGMS